MNLTIRFFATLKEHAGVTQLEVELSEPASVRNLLAALLQECPALESALESTIVAVNQEFADVDQMLTPNDEVVLFPPVSGG